MEETFRQIITILKDGFSLITGQSNKLPRFHKSNVPYKGSAKKIYFTPMFDVVYITEFSVDYENKLPELGIIDLDFEVIKIRECSIVAPIGKRITSFMIETNLENDPITIQVFE